MIGSTAPGVPLLRCVTFDRRGHARSDDSASGYDFDTLAADIGAVLDQLDLRNVMLVGQSMGAAEVVRYLSRFNNGRVTRAVLVSTTTPFILKTSDNPDGAEPAAIERGRELFKKDRAARIADGAARNAERLSRPDLDGPSVHGPRQHARDTVDGLLIVIVAMGRHPWAFARRNRHLERRDAASGLVTGQQETDRDGPEINGFVGGIHGESARLCGHGRLVLLIKEFPGPDGVRPGTLAERAGVSKQAMNQLLKSLEGFGYLERPDAEDDGRSSIVRFTRRGRAAYAKMADLLRDIEREWSAELGPKRFAALKALLVRVWQSPLSGNEPQQTGSKRRR